MNFWFQTGRDAFKASVIAELSHTRFLFVQIFLADRKLTDERSIIGY